MNGLMMDIPLLVSDLISRADRHHGDTAIFSKCHDGTAFTYSYSDAHVRARKLAQALLRQGVAPGDRVASLAWNSHRHFECYYGVSGMGAVMHTINPRLFLEQIRWIVNDAQDRVLFVDPHLLPLVADLRLDETSVRAVVVMGDRTDYQGKAESQTVLCYEEMLAAESGDYEWPRLPETTASGLCYTSGTTGNPKGVLYHHRSTVLHALLTALPDMMNLSARDVVMPVVPMFHVNAWGLPYSCALAGSKLVLPGPNLDGKSLYELMEAHGVTMSAGVPTVWAGLLNFMEVEGKRFSRPPRLVIGGSACPPSMIERFEKDYGVQVLHAWGMTEMSPIGTICTLKEKHAGLDAAERLNVLSKAGRPHFGIEMKIVDDSGAELPRDGIAAGHLLVRGVTVLSGYYKGMGGNVLQQGWFPTGDVATLDRDCYMQITDRSKDVIKSGGEWISSIDLENIAVSHPDIAEAAVIGITDEKWGERPVCIAVRKEGASISEADLLAFYTGKVAKWSRPDAVYFVDQLPHTATGKLSKVTLRQQFQQQVASKNKESS